MFFYTGGTQECVDQWSMTVHLVARDAFEDANIDRLMTTLPCFAINYGCNHGSDLNFEHASKFTKKVALSSSYLPMKVFHRHQVLPDCTASGLLPNGGNNMVAT